MANQTSTMNRIEILNVVTTPSSVPMGNKTRRAPHGYVEYAMGSKVFYYCIDPGQDKGLIDNLVTGERYNVTSEEWMKGLRKAYKWVSTQHVGTGNVYPPKALLTAASVLPFVPPVAVQPVVTTRSALITLCGNVANQTGNTEDVKDLVTLIMTALIEDENVLSGVL